MGMNMDTYTLLKFAHVIGFLLIFGGVFAIFLSYQQGAPPFRVVR
jgi:hypothetical protein